MVAKNIEKPNAAKAGLGIPQSKDSEARVAEPITSSKHLAQGAWPELSEFEFGLIVVNNAFSRWIVRCMAAAGLSDLAATDVLLLHHVHHRGRGKRLADICFTLNYEDAHIVAYSLRKLVALGLIETSKAGKEVVYSTSEIGNEWVLKYREVRNACLMPSVQSQSKDAKSLADMAQALRYLSSVYDQAARAAASL
jgi:predicted MarR family transcription regulator